MARLDTSRPTPGFSPAEADFEGDQATPPAYSPLRAAQAGWRRSPRSRLVPARRQRKGLSRGSRARRWLLRSSLVLVLGLLLLTQANGAFGAWAADTLRGVLGPQITAQIEAWYLGLSDTVHQVTYHLGGQQATPPWKG